MEKLIWEIWKCSYFKKIWFRVFGKLVWEVWKCLDFQSNKLEYFECGEAYLQGLELFGIQRIRLECLIGYLRNLEVVRIQKHLPLVFSIVEGLICKGWIFKSLFESIEGVLSFKKYSLSALSFVRLMWVHWVWFHIFEWLEHLRESSLFFMKQNLTWMIKILSPYLKASGLIWCMIDQTRVIKVFLGTLEKKWTYLRWRRSKLSDLMVVGHIWEQEPLFVVNWIWLEWFESLRTHLTP